MPASRRSPIGRGERLLRQRRTAATAARPTTRLRAEFQRALMRGARADASRLRQDRVARDRRPGGCGRRRAQAPGADAPRPQRAAEAGREREQPRPGAGAARLAPHYAERPARARPARTRPPPRSPSCCPALILLPEGGLFDRLVARSRKRHAESRLSGDEDMLLKPPAPAQGRARHAWTGTTPAPGARSPADRPSQRRRPVHLGRRGDTERRASCD